MKRNFLKTFALVAMLFSALTMSAASGVDWSTYSFLGDGAGGGKYTDKYKVSSAEGLTVVNIQLPGFTTEPSIYATVPAGILDCNVSSTIQGAGIALHLSAFTAQETQVTINYAGGSCTFWVYYADGTTGATPGTPAEVYDVNFALASNGSSAEATSGNAASAIDGNTGTRWESASEDPQTWTLDLGQERVFNTLEIVWEGAYGKTFTVSVSSDNATWTPVWTVEGQSLAGFPHTQSNVIDKTTARYIQFHGTARGTGYGYSFWEFRVYLAGTSTLTTLEAKPATNLTKVGETNTITITPKDQNGKVMTGVGEVTYTITPADAGTITNNVYTPNKIGSASIVAAIGEIKAAAFEVVAYGGENIALSTDINNSKVIAQSEFAPSGTDAWHAIDGNEGSVWQGSTTNGTANDDEARTYDSWFVVDFGAYFDVNLVSIKFEGACSQNYHVDFSADNTAWVEAYNHVGNAGVNGHTKLIYGNDLQNKNKVRYARFWSTKAATQYGMKIFEFKVFGTPWVAPTDNVKPVMGTATLVSKTFNSAIIAVTATDNTEVGSYHVVDATKAYDQKCGVTEGQITVKGLQPATTYNFTISALDLALNESENSVQLAVTTENHLLKPTAAPAAPTVDAKKVISIFSDTYPTDNNFTAHEGWGDATIYEELTFGDNKVRYYTNLNWLGWQYINAPINALNMEKIHLDIWAENDGALKVTPIYGGTGLTTNDTHGKSVQLTGQQWNSIDLDLATDFAGLDLSSIFQLKFDGAIGGNVFALDNVYFYRVSELADTEAPTGVTATLVATDFTTLTVACTATDNSGVVSFDILSGETKLATGGAKSGETTNIVVANLEAGKEYNLSVVAYDANENKAAAVTVTATTNALPAPATTPNLPAEDVYSIYSDTYTSPVYFIIGTWGQTTITSEIDLANNEKAYYFKNTNYLGWEINNNTPMDVTAYPNLHIDVYALAAGTLEITPISAGPKEKAYTLTLEANKWNSFNISTDQFTGVEFDKFIQIKFDKGQNASYFIDNVYFFKTPSTGLEQNTSATMITKIIENGTIYIIRDGVRYDLMGRIVF